MAAWAAKNAYVALARRGICQRDIVVASKFVVQLTGLREAVATLVVQLRLLSDRLKRGKARKT